MLYLPSFLYIYEWQYNIVVFIINDRTRGLDLQYKELIGTELWLYFLTPHANKGHDFQDVFLATSLFPCLLKKILCSIDLAEKRQINSWKICIFSTVLCIHMPVH